MDSSRSSGKRDAASEALGLLARRPLTVSELRQRLADRGHPPEAIEAACEQMLRAGYLDDRRLAEEFIATRAERLGHGPERLIEELCRRGVESSVAESAMRRAVASGEVIPREILRRRIRRRLAGVRLPLDRGGLARVYNALRRAGFDADSIRKELEPYGVPTSHDEPLSNETSDDFA